MHYRESVCITRISHLLIRYGSSQKCRSCKNDNSIFTNPLTSREKNAYTSALATWSSAHYYIVDS